MSIKSKINNLIAAANTKTGAASADLTNAVQTLIDGYGAGSGGGGSDLDALLNGSITDVDSQATAVKSYALQNCRSLLSANIPNVETIENNAFYNCSAMTSFSAPNAKTLGNYALYGCNQLPYIDLPNAESVGISSFQACSSLTRASLPNVSNAATTTFSNCSSLQTVDFGKSPVGASTFFRCTVLSTLILRSTEVQTLYAATVFDRTPFAANGTGGTVYVPEALIEAYQNATNWSTLYAAGTCTFVALEGSEYE